MYSETVYTRFTNTEILDSFDYFEYLKELNMNIIKCIVKLSYIILSYPVLRFKH